MSKTIEGFLYRDPLDAAPMEKHFGMLFEVFHGTGMRGITYGRLRLGYGWWTISDGAHIEEAGLLRLVIHRDSPHLLKPLRYDGIRWTNYKGQPWEETPHHLNQPGPNDAYTLHVAAADRILAASALHGSSFERRGIPFHWAEKEQNCKTVFEGI